MKTLIISSVFACLALTATNAQATESVASDSLNMTELNTQVDKHGILTKPQVDALGEQAKELYYDKKCAEAIPALTEYAQQANWMANMIAATLEPFYEAGDRERNRYDRFKAKQLAKIEASANDYKLYRNIALAMKGQCLMKMGKQQEALPVLLETLNLLDIDNEIWWERTRNSLLEIIEVPTD